MESTYPKCKEPLQARFHDRRPLREVPPLTRWAFRYPPIGVHHRNPLKAEARYSQRSMNHCPWWRSAASSLSVAVALACAPKNTFLDGDASIDSGRDAMEGGCGDLQRDPSNCGVCGHACSSRACAQGECSFHTVFVTSIGFTGSLNGVAGADQQCQTLGTAAGISLRMCSRAGEAGNLGGHCEVPVTKRRA